MTSSYLPFAAGFATCFVLVAAACILIGAAWGGSTLYRRRSSLGQWGRDKVESKSAPVMKVDMDGPPDLESIIRRGQAKIRADVAAKLKKELGVE